MRDCELFFLKDAEKSGWYSQSYPSYKERGYRTVHHGQERMCLIVKENGFNFIETVVKPRTLDSIYLLAKTLGRCCRNKCIQLPPLPDWRGFCWPGMRAGTSALGERVQYKEAGEMGENLFMTFGICLSLCQALSQEALKISKHCVKNRGLRA